MAMTDTAPGYAGAVESQTRTEPGRVRDYVALMKPRVMSLVIFTAIVGLVAAPVDPHPVIAIAIVLAIAVGAGGSAALNMAYEGDIDSVMERTKTRPVPSGRISAAEAASFGMVLSALSVGTLTVAANVTAGALLAFTIFFYAVVYTRWLKRSTPQNIVIGGLAGALPPAVAWAAATGSLSLAPVLMVALIFIWTPPHFWALALLTSKQYAKAGVPMMPVARGAKRTRFEIVAYAVLVVPTGVALAFTGAGGPATLAVAVVLGLAFLAAAIAVGRTRAGDAGDDGRGAKAAKRLFGVSILYLFGVFAAMLVDAGVTGGWS